MKRKLSILLVLIMVLAMGVPALAAGGTGSITINGNETFSLDGREFNAYKILDVTLGANDAVAYSVPTGMETFYQAQFPSISATPPSSAFDQAVMAAIGAMTTDSEAMEEFGKAALAAAKATGSGITPVSATGTATPHTAVFSDIPLGYYVIEDTTTPAPGNVVSALMIDTTMPNAEIDVKATLPKIDKDILEGDPETEEKTNEVSIGDTVKYQIKTQVPDMRGYNKYYFIVNDTLSKGLTYADNMIVKIDGVTKIVGADNDTGDYHVEKTDNSDGTTSLVIVFHNFLQYKEGSTGKDVVITFDAILNDEAAIGTSNDNDVTLTYSNNPKFDYKGKNIPGDDEPTGETPKSTTKTYTTSITILKKDDKDNILTGAAFKITGEGVNLVVTTGDVFVEDTSGTFWKLKDGSYTTETPTTATEEYYESTTVKYKKESKVTIDSNATGIDVEAFVDADGKVVFAGLGAGVYTITETVVPKGYNGMDPIELTISFDKTTEEFSVTSPAEMYGNTNTIKLKVVNKTGAELPGTGGIGTTIFYVVGGVLALAAVVLLVTKKKMSSKES